jgi:hypothetical protein
MSTGTASSSAAVWRARDPTTTPIGERPIAWLVSVISCVRVSAAAIVTVTARGA